MLNKILLRRSFLPMGHRSFAVKVERNPLPYELNGLEPVLSAQLLDYHYNKHHKTYVDNLNTFASEAQEALEKNDVKKHASLCQIIKFNAGGHYNHTFFWESLTPIKLGGGKLPEDTSALHKLIKAQWGSISEF
jgi:Fe-Mn family superoxide dismutase